MDVSEALARRRMTRSFSAQPIDAELLVRLARDALRSPTAGNARGIELLVLSGPDEVAQYFAATTDADWRRRSARFAGLARASGVIVVLADPHTYVERYGAED
ncbi:MAG: nitroreductase family protein, partial [Actinomycetes bacterium]